MRHEAIYATHPQAVRIDDSFGAFDINEKLIELDESAISQKLAELQAAEPMRLLRVERDQLLAATDWRATIDYQGTNQDEWLAYRQRLRDLPANTEDASNPTWPIPPESD